MQKLISQELVELRAAWAGHLETVYKNFDFAGRGCTQGQGVVEAVKEYLNDRIYFVMLEDITLGRDAYRTADHIREMMADTTDDLSTFVSDFLGEESPSPMIEELAEEFVTKVEESIMYLRSDHWSNLVSDAQESIAAAAHCNGAEGWLSSLCLDTEERAVFLVSRNDLERVGSYVIDEETTIIDFMTAMENEDKIEYTFGSDRFILIVNNKFTPDDSEFLSEEDVLIVYKLKRG